MADPCLEADLVGECAIRSAPDTLWNQSFGERGCRAPGAINFPEAVKLSNLRPSAGSQI